MLFRFGVGCPIVRHHITEVQAIAGDYAKEVAPIIKTNCRTCQQKGGVAPWAMDSHKQVAGRGAMIREVIRTKLMPPWDADPAYGKFSNDCGITIAEARTIRPLAY